MSGGRQELERRLLNSKRVSWDRNEGLANPGDSYCPAAI